MILSTTRLFAVGSALGVAMAFPVVASAGTASAPIGISATIANNCVVTASPPVDITDTYDPVGANASVAASKAGTFSYQCTTGFKPLSITNDNGQNPSGTTPRLVSGANFLSYALNYTLPTFQTTGTVQTVPFTVTLPGGQNQPAGLYRDVLTFTINF